MEHKKQKILVFVKLEFSILSLIPAHPFVHLFRLKLMNHHVWYTAVTTIIMRHSNSVMTTQIIFQRNLTNNNINIQRNRNYCLHHPRVRHQVHHFLVALALPFHHQIIHPVEYMTHWWLNFIDWNLIFQNVPFSHSQAQHSEREQLTKMDVLLYHTFLSTNMGKPFNREQVCFIQLQFLRLLLPK